MMLWGSIINFNLICDETGCFCVATGDDFAPHIYSSFDWCYQEKILGPS
jgi:hypothetical protein